MKLFWFSTLALIITASNCFAKPVIKIADNTVSTGNQLSVNGDFESTEDGKLSSWEAYGSGYTIAKGQGRNGSTALYCESTAIDGRFGGLQTIEVNQKEARPIRITAWSKCENVDGSPNIDYSIYVDMECVDGTPMWGNTRAFLAGTSDWNKWSYVIYPIKPVKTILAYCLFRNRKGKVWFDDVKIEELKSMPGTKMLQGQVITMATNSKNPKTVEIGTKAGLSLSFNGSSISSLAYSGRKFASKSPAGFLVRDFKKNSDYYEFEKATVTKTSLAATCPELGLKVNAKFDYKKDSIHVTGKITDTTSKDRAVNLLFALPIDAVGWNWWDDVNRKRKITASSTNVTALEYMTTVDIPCGSTSTSSLYPIAAISSAKDGMGIGVDMDKASVNRILYNSSTKQFIVSFDFGLVPENVNFPGSAEFSFVIYRYDPAWGFRQAWAKYAEMFPEFFKVRTTKHGIWMPFGDISRIQGWQDFGFRYHEGIDNVPFDNQNDIQAFRYSEPTTWWMSMPKEMDRSEATVMGEMERIARDDKGYLGTLANAVKNSVMHDAAGKPAYLVQDAPWCNGVVWNLNPNPFIPEKPNGGTILWNDQIKESDYGPNATNVRAGEYLDSLEGYVTTDLNYRREHFKHSTVPLTFDAQGRPVIFKGLAIYEMTKWIASEVHGINKLMFANAVPYRFAYLTPWLDIMGTETNWLSDGKYVPEINETMMFRRTLCYAKPYLLLMNTRFDDFGVDMVEKYFRRCAFYGFMPGMFSFNAANEAYFDTPRWYNRDRKMFKRYIPLIRLVAEAGWQPVTLAKTTTKDVFIERYGKRYLTMLNNTDASVKARVQVNTAKLGLKPNSKAKDLFSRKTIDIKNSVFTIGLDMGDSVIIDLQP